MKRAFLSCLITLGMLFLTHCAPPASDPTQGLPTPRSWVITSTSQDHISGFPTSSPAPWSSTPGTTPQEIARQTYGSRLILSIEIPAIGLQSPVVATGWQVDLDQARGDAPDVEWDSPGSAVGWVLSSALPDTDGNIILYGHNNINGSILKDLSNLATGDTIVLHTGIQPWQYRVDQVLILPVFTADEETGGAYQVYLQSTGAPRLTVISCWPPVSNTHRVIVIAYPDSIR